jgi:transcriptional regulator with XRE-family HTH domain
MLSEIVSRLRADRGWSTSDLARAAELPTTFVEAVERDRERADGSQLASLARALDVQPSVLTAQWADIPGNVRFRDSLRPLVEFVPSPSGMDVFRVDRSFDRVMEVIIELWYRRGLTLDADLDSYADALSQISSASIVQVRAFAAAAFARSLINARRSTDVSVPPTEARSVARELVAAALEESVTLAEFDRLFSNTVDTTASWFAHMETAFNACVRAFGVERTELEFAVIEGRAPAMTESVKQQRVSGLNSVLSSASVANALQRVY